MTQFTVHSVDSAPEPAKRSLEQQQKALGFLPNLYGVMAEAPTLLRAYLGVSAQFEGTSLTPTERQTVLLATAFSNRCHY